jgi:hypothetical protein
MHDAVWLNANLATMRDGGTPYGALRDGAIAVKGWSHFVGRRAQRVERQRRGRA